MSYNRVFSGGSNMSTIDMRVFAKGAGINMSFPAGSTIFREGDPGDCLYVLEPIHKEVESDESVVIR
jgi:hypothetical protein